jgi:NTP pyrophosphatase (non-canonical NTP hydrolase)
MTNENILAEVAVERDQQRFKFGTQRHDFTVWMTVLGEEFGEACKALLDQRKMAAEEAENPLGLKLSREELIQVAAVAVATIEHIDEVIG